MNTTNTQLEPDWHPNQAALKDLNDAFQQAHSGVQWLARMVNSFCVPTSDGSHLHMQWDSTRPVIKTPAIAEATTVEMRLPDMVLQFVEQGAPTDHPVELDDNSPAQIEAWTLIELLHRGIDRDAYSKSLPYDVSHLMTGDAHDYQTFGKELAFQDMARWLVLAGDLLKETIQDSAVSNTHGGADTRFAPEDFSLFVRAHVDSNRPPTASYVELGFCGGTDSDKGPYFYTKLARDEKTQRLFVNDIERKALKRGDVISFFSVPAQLKLLNGA